MTEKIFALVDPVTQKLDPGLIPGGAGGRPADVAFPFAGQLVADTGRFYWLSPPAAIRLLRLTIVLGTLGTGGGTVTAALLVNGAALATVNVAAGSRLAARTAFDVEIVPPNQLISIDITGVPSAGATRPGDAVVQVLWEYA